MCDFTKLEKELHNMSSSDLLLVSQMLHSEMTLRHFTPNTSVDNSKYREFNSKLSLIHIKGDRGFGKNFDMIRRVIDYSGFEIIDPPKKLKKVYDKINKSKDTLLYLKKKEK